jgi:4-hydroxybenzoyl-CoA reductase subunit beta
MEYLPNFHLHRPGTIADAVKLRAANPEARYLAGGTDMVVNIRRGIERPDEVIDITGIAELQAIESEGGGLAVGALVPLAKLASDPAVRANYAAIAQAAGSVAGHTHRVYGTVGGNLCLDTRCLFYNQSEWWRKSNDYCFKHRGTVCHVAPAGQFCFAAFSGDVAPAMLLFDAEIDIAGPAGGRRVPLSALYRDDGRDHLTLAPGELLTRVHLPAPPANAKSGYAKSRVRASIDFPLAGVGVRLAMDGPNVLELRAAITAVNPYPHVIEGTEALAGKPLDDDALDSLREMVRTQSKPMRTTTVKPWYRRRVVGALARKLAARLSAD